MLTSNQIKLVKNINWLFMAYVYRFIIGFFTVAMVSRYLGPTKYGLYSYSLSAYSFIELFLLFINQEVLKKSIIEESDTATLLKTVIIFQICLSLLIFSTAQVLLWGFDLENGLRRILLSLFSVGLLLRPFDVISYFFSAKLRNDLLAKSEVGVVTVFNMMRITLVFLRESIQVFVWVYVFSKFIDGIFLLYYYLKNFKVKILDGTFSTKLIRFLLKSSLPLFIATAASIVFTRIDQLMLGNMLDDRSVGIYAAVVKLTEPWIFIAAIFTQSIFPNLIETFSKDKDNFHYKVHKSLVILTYISIAIIVATLIGGEYAVTLVFSDKYIDSIPLLKIHVFYLIFIYWIHISNQYDVIIGATHITMIKTIIASVFNVGLNYLLIPKIGILGATYATIISYAFSSFLLNICFKQTRPLFYLQVQSLFFWKIKWFHTKD